MLRGVYAMLFLLWSGDPPGDLLSVVIGPEVQCPRPEAVLAALAARLAPLPVVRESDARGRHHLSLHGEGLRGLALELWERDVKIVDRTLQVAPEECALAADTIALITLTWLEAPSPATDPAAPATREEPPGAEATPEAALSVGAPPALAAAHEDRRRAVVVPPLAASPSPYHVRLELAAGTIMQVDQRVEPVATGSLGIEGVRDRWSLALRGQLETERTVDGVDTVSVAHKSVELSVGHAAVREPSFDLAVWLGGGVDVISADARSFENADPPVVVSPIASLALRPAFRPTEDLGLFASMEFVLSLRRGSFVSEGEPLAVTPRARARILVGASWHVF